MRCMYYAHTLIIVHAMVNIQSLQEIWAEKNIRLQCSYSHTDTDISPKAPKRTRHTSYGQRMRGKRSENRFSVGGWQSARQWPFVKSTDCRRHSATRANSTRIYTRNRCSVGFDSRVIGNQLSDMCVCVCAFASATLCMSATSICRCNAVCSVHTYMNALAKIRKPVYFA